MATEWRELPLEQCMDAIIDYRGKTPKKTSSGIPLVTAKIIKNGSIQAITEFIAGSDYDSWMRRGLPLPGDVVMTTEAPLGEVAQLDGRKVALAQRVITLRGKKDLLDNTFLKYLMISDYVQHQLDGRATGTTVKGIKQSELRKIFLKFPSIDDQRAIAEVLGSLDGKLELNRQINATLESMAQAMFKSWFVDFDPVIDNALAAGNPIPEPLQARAEKRTALLAAASAANTRSASATDNAHPTQTAPHTQPGTTPPATPLQPLPADIRALFPDSFVFNEEMGWVPEGWSGIPVDVALQINPKVTLRKGSEAAFVDMKALPTSGFGISDVIQKSYSGGAKFQQGDVLFARITPCLENGKTGLVDFLPDDEVGFGSTEFIVMRGRGALKSAFVACLARLDSFRAHCQLGMVGSSGRQRVQNSSFSNYFLALPTDEMILTRFDQMASPLFRRMSVAKMESVSLGGLRDTLLPKLLSGQIQLHETEMMVAEAL